MPDFIVQISLKCVVEADNPGRAASDMAERLRKLLETHDPMMLSSMQREVIAYQVIQFPTKY